MAMPRKEDIHQYWLSRFYWLEEDFPTCFVCGRNGRLDRAHLVPRSLGGGDEVGNVVLLCRRCHSKAPNIATSKDIMLKWIEEEGEKYDHLFHYKKDDVAKLYKSTQKISERLTRVFSNENAELFHIFFKEKLQNDIIITPGFQDANDETFFRIVEYYAESENLEQEYLEFLIKREISKE